MKLFKQLGYASAMTMLLAASAQAAVTIHVPEDIDLQVVNLEKPQREGGLFSSDKPLTLPNGLNQIAFRYSHNFVQRDNAENVYGPLIVMKFNAADQELDISVPQYLDASAAKRKIDHHQWALLEHDSQQPIDVTTDRISISGFVLGKNFLDEVESYNKKGGKAAVGLTYVTIAQPAPATASSANLATATEANVPKVVTSQLVDAEAAPQNGVLGGLQTLYLQASEQERKAFRKWIIDQE